MSVIKTLKQKNENGIEESVYPKTTTKAIVDSDTNKTLDVILDELNDKIDNIEITGGGDASNKVDKSGDTMTGMLTVKDNVSVEGDLFVPIAPEQSYLNSGQPNTNFTAPTAGGWQDNVSYLMQDMANSKTFLGSYLGAVDSEGYENYWHNVISTRHRNGRGDGNGFGMYLRSAMTQAGSLCWTKQYDGNWENEKVILDSSNYYKSFNNFPQGTYVCHSNSTSLYWGTEGYIVLASIDILQGWCSGATIEFTVSSLSKGQGKICIGFSNTQHTVDTTVTYFTTYNTVPMYYVLTKKSDRVTVEIIAYKQRYESFAISHINATPHILFRTSISYPDTFEETLREGAVQAETYYFHESRSIYIQSNTVNFNLEIRRHYILSVYTDNTIYAAWLICPGFPSGFCIFKLSSEDPRVAFSISGNTFTATIEGASNYVLTYMHLT